MVMRRRPPPPSITHGRPYGQNTLIFVTTCPPVPPPLSTQHCNGCCSHIHLGASVHYPPVQHIAVQSSEVMKDTPQLSLWRDGGLLCQRERERASAGQPTTCSYYGLGMLYLDHLHSCSTIFLYSYAMHRNVNGDWCMNGSIFALCIQVVLRILC